MKELKLKDLNLSLEVLIIINASQPMNNCMLSKSLKNMKKAKITNHQKSSLKIRKE